MNWKSFSELKWYEDIIALLFKFASVTSEPLLVSSLIFSAANVISKGTLSANNVIINNMFAVATSIAIEAGGGVSLVVGLEARRDRDEIKAWMYLVLSGLLALTGGTMLFLQLTGWEEQGNTPFMIGLFCLRCAVSVAFIYLSRTKRIRFSPAPEEPIIQQVVSNESKITEEMIRTIIREVIKSEGEQFFQNQIAERITEQRVIEQVKPEQPKLSEPTPEQVRENIVRLTGRIRQSKGSGEKIEKVRVFLNDNPNAKVRDVAEEFGVAVSTAHAWMTKAKEPPLLLEAVNNE